MDKSENIADWQTTGKTIRKLIQELRTFEDQDLEVRISVDGRVASFPISLVLKSKGSCLLAYFPEKPKRSE